MLPSWERERLIDGLSGAELEVWESLGHPLTPKMQNRLDHWRKAKATERAEREEAERLRRVTKLNEDADAMRAEVRDRNRATRLRDVPKVYHKSHRRACPAHGHKHRRAA